MTTTPNASNHPPFYKLAIRSAAAPDCEAAEWVAFVEAFAWADEDTRLGMVKAVVACDPPESKQQHPPFISGSVGVGGKPEAGGRSPVTEGSCVRCGTNLMPNDGGRIVRRVFCPRGYLEVP